jgi:drug/metabolite transporter (DMT)-like permease
LLARGLVLAANVAWGSADFPGGLKSRVLPLLVVIGGSQLIGLVLVAALAAAHGSGPSQRTLLWGALGGVAALVGAVLREHVSTHQRFGIGLAVAGVALIAV